MHPLISTSELRERLADVTILDVRYRLGGAPGAEAFAVGHIPGAIYVDLETALAGAAHATPGAGRHPLPSPADLQSSMRAAGVREDRPVVVYDDWGGRAAARCWWLLRWAGKDDVQVLDGGWAAWRDSGGDVGVGDDAPLEEGDLGDLVVRPGRLPVADADAVAAWQGVRVDARAPERFRGDVEPVDPVAGHIPGAVNVPTETNLAADGRFRSVTQLAPLYAAAGVDGSEDVVAYCGSGVTACHDVLALAVIGIPATLYAGSWSGWTSDPDRAVEIS